MRNYAKTLSRLWITLAFIQTFLIVLLVQTPIVRAELVTFSEAISNDIVWRNKTTGQNRIWLMNGTVCTAVISLKTISDKNWEIVSSGDFNKDGRLDILWRNKVTGRNLVWLMKGSTCTAVISLKTISDPNWEIVGCSDFNSDGNLDIIWRNKATGQNRIWLMNGNACTAVICLKTISDKKWAIVSSGDFNKDGKPDIVWRNKTTGRNLVWLMNGTLHTSVISLTTISDLNWEIGGTGDFNNDGNLDIIWRNKTTGRNRVWLMKGSARTAVISLKTILDQNWEIVACSSQTEIQKEMKDIVRSYIEANSDDNCLMLGYGTNRVSTRDSMIAAIFYAHSSDFEKVNSLLKGILPYQYTGPNQKHYGNFPTFIGDSPPFDYNWSAFIGAYLCYLYIEFGEHLTQEVKDEAITAIRLLAKHRLSQLWNRPDTTNINILSAYFLLQAGRILDEIAIRQEAETFWNFFFNQSIKEGIREFNGLNYVSVHLYGLDFISRHEWDNLIGGQAGKIMNNILWNLCSRYHSGYNQLSGPFSRTTETSIMGLHYSTLEAILWKASKGKFPLDNKLPLNSDPLHAVFPMIFQAKVPLDWVNHVFGGDNLEKHYRETISVNNDLGGGYVQTTGWVGNLALVGSVNHFMLKYYPKQQSRPLIVHTGNSVLQMLIDGSESNYKKLYFNSVQFQGNVLAEVVNYEKDDTVQLKVEASGEDVSASVLESNRVKLSLEGVPVWIVCGDGGSLKWEVEENRVVIWLLPDVNDWSDFSFGVVVGDFAYIAPKIQKIVSNGILTNTLSLSYGAELQIVRNQDYPEPTRFLVDGKEEKFFLPGTRIGEYFDHN